MSQSFLILIVLLGMCLTVWLHFFVFPAVEWVTMNSVCYKTKYSALLVHNTNLNAGVLPAVAQSYAQVDVALRSAVKKLVNGGLCYRSSPEEVRVSCPSTAKLVLDTKHWKY